MNTTSTQPATRASRPLINYPMYFERDYCPECMIAHWVEKTRRGLVICHGEDFFFAAQTTRTHYNKHQGKGFELIPMNDRQLDWLMAQEVDEPQYIDVDQGW